MKNTLLTIFLLLAPAGACADTVRLGADHAQVGLGDTVTIVASLSATTSENAIEGQLIYPPSLTVKDIKDGDSSVNFWLEGPHLVASDTIVFSGMTPGGFRQDDARLFAVTFIANATGTADLLLHNVNVYANDGVGTKTSLLPGTMRVTVGPALARVSGAGGVDRDPPEDFTPIVSEDPSVFGGANFLVFATVDKGSGMDHYEVREGALAFFRTARSPYLLLRQKLDRPVYVRAYDKAGNYREVVVPARVVVPIWAQEEWIALAIALILLMELINMIVHRKLHHRIRKHLSPRFRTIRDIEEPVVVLEEHEHHPEEHGEDEEEIGKEDEKPNE